MEWAVGALEDLVLGPMETAAMAAIGGQPPRMPGGGYGAGLGGMPPMPGSYGFGGTSFPISRRPWR